MYSNDVADLSTMLGNFKIEGMPIRYNSFVPRLYNLCMELGFKPGKIMPSRAFCSDENQGYPVILITKHFGTFPFNHGMVGGVVDTTRHGPHAHHGKDSVIIHASHVAYDPATNSYGSYRRLQTEHEEGTPTCGLVDGMLSQYMRELEFAQRRIFLQRNQGSHLISIDNSFLDPKREEGLFLHLDKLLKPQNGSIKPFKVYSTSKSYVVSELFEEALGKEYEWKAQKGEPIGANLKPEFFYFKRSTEPTVEGKDHIENNILVAMPLIVTSRHPTLVAAMVNIQEEFNRVYRSIAQNPTYHGKKVLFVSGLNIDISPSESQTFPLTKFVPWAAYYQNSNGRSSIMEQSEIAERLNNQSDENPHQIDLEEAIARAQKHMEIVIPNPFS